jgi:methylmalonyl-CoA mutase N-terminal domain/subunit
MNKIKALKEKRGKATVENCLKKIKEHAANNQNLMPVVIDAVENFCTLGEISDTLRKVFGEYK